MPTKKKDAISLMVERGLLLRQRRHDMRIRIHDFIVSELLVDGGVGTMKALTYVLEGECQDLYAKIVEREAVEYAAEHARDEK